MRPSARLPVFTVASRPSGHSAASAPWQESAQSSATLIPKAGSLVMPYGLAPLFLTNKTSNLLPAQPPIRLSGSAGLRYHGGKRPGETELGITRKFLMAGACVLLLAPVQAPVQAQVPAGTPLGAF